MYRADLSRRIGPAFADAAVDAAMDSLDKHGYPAGWGTSPRPVQANPQMVAIKVPAKAYKPAHGGYPAPQPAVPNWRDAANWLRNNYQDYPNIASLCEGMIAASPYANATYTSPTHLENALPGGKYTDEGESARVADYNRGWNDYRKEVRKKIKAITTPITQAAC